MSGTTIIAQFFMSLRFDDSDKKVYILFQVSLLSVQMVTLVCR